MNSFSRKAISVGLVFATALWFAGSSFAPLANAAGLTSNQVSSILALLQSFGADQATINNVNAALTGQPVTTPSTGGSTSCYSYTKDLTLGAKGADVTALQQFLNSKGYLTVSATGYFGALTKAALAKFQAASNISPAAGYFGPITMKAVNAACGTVSVGGSGTIVVPSGSGLSVSLASDNPAAGNIPVGTSELVPVLKLNFAAGSQQTVTGLVINRTGLSSDQDIQNVYLMQGSQVIATNLSMSNGVITFSNGAGLFTVLAGQTQEITVAVSLVSTATGHTYQFSVPSASSVTTLGGATTGGTFPITGNSLTSASVANLGGLQITNASAGYAADGSAKVQVNAGQSQFNVGQFSFLAQNQAIQVRSITFTLIGSVAASDVQNIQLYNGTQLLGTVAAVSGNTATFNLSSSPLQLAAGQSANLYLYGDIKSGVNRYFQFSIQHAYDVTVQDMMFNIGALPSVIQNVAGGIATANVFPAYGSYVSINQGTLTVTRDVNSPVNYVLPGGTNQTVAKFDFAAAGEAVRITGFTVTLLGNGGMAGAANLTNLKVIDDQGTQIGNTVTPATTTSYSSLNYIVAANTTRVVSVVMDVASAATGTIQANISAITGQGYTSLASVTGGSQNGNTLTASANTLSASLNSGMSTVTVVAGQSQALVASYALTAGAASGVSITGIQLSGNHVSNFQNLVVKYGSTQVGNGQPTLNDSTTYTFTASSPINVAAGGQVIFNVYADVKSGASTGTISGVVQMPTTGVSAVATATNQPVTSVASSAITSQSVVIASSGTLSYTTYNMPQGVQVGMGMTGVTLAQYQVTGSNNEAITVNNIYLTATSSITGLFTDYKVVANVNGVNTTYGGVALNGTASPYTFEIVGVNLTIPQSATAYFTVTADANNFSSLNGSYTTSTPNSATSSVGIYQVDYQGQASQQTANATSSSVSNPFTVLKTSLAVAQASGAPTGSGSYSSYLVGAYTFTAGNFAATLSSLDLGQQINNASGTPGTTNITVYNNTIGQNATTTSLSTSGTTSTVTMSVNVPANQSVTLYVYSNVSGATTKPANSSASITDQIKLTNFAWSDGVETGLGPNPSYNLPTQAITGSANAVVIVQ